MLRNKVPICVLAAWSVVSVSHDIDANFCLAKHRDALPQGNGTRIRVVSEFIGDVPQYWLFYFRIRKIVPLTLNVPP